MSARIGLFFLDMGALIFLVAGFLMGLNVLEGSEAERLFSYGAFCFLFSMSVLCDTIERNRPEVNVNVPQGDSEA